MGAVVLVAALLAWGLLEYGLGRLIARVVSFVRVRSRAGWDEANPRRTGDDAAAPLAASDGDVGGSARADPTPDPKRLSGGT